MDLRFRRMGSRMLVVVLASACTATSSSGGSGGHAQPGSGGQSGQGGQGGTGGQGATAMGGRTGGTFGQGGLGTSAAGGGAGGEGGKSGQGGQGASPAAGGGPGGTGGNAGQGGAAVVGAGGGGGQGARTSSGGGGTGGGAGLDAGDSGKDASASAGDGGGNPSRVLLADEGNRRVMLVSLDNPATALWSTQLGDTTKYGDSMRDLQLVGGDRVAVSVAKGYVELDLKTGEIKKEMTKLDGVESLRRLPSGNTVLGANADGGVTLQELDSQDAAVAAHKVTFTSYSQLRLFRRTPQGTFLLGVGAKLAEVNWDKQTLWEMTIPDGNYVYQGLRLPDKTIAVTSGYGAALLVIDATAKKVLTTVGGKGQPDATTIVPNFYGGFQVLPNGHFVITNWEGHGAGHGGTGIQLLEYDPSGLLVWKWKQDSKLVSSLHNVIVLDGLDTSKLHDDLNGVLAPVTQ